MVCPSNLLFHNDKVICHAIRDLQGTDIILTLKWLANTNEYHLYYEALFGTFACHTWGV